MHKAELFFEYFEGFSGNFENFLFLLLQNFHFSQFGFVQYCDAPKSREELEGRRVGCTGADRVAVGAPESGNMSGMHSVLSVLLFMVITVLFRPSVNFFSFPRTSC